MRDADEPAHFYKVDTPFEDQPGDETVGDVEKFGGLRLGVQPLELDRHGLSRTGLRPAGRRRCHAVISDELVAAMRRMVWILP